MSTASRLLTGVLLLSACGEDKPTVTDDRVGSYCEALCDWAADCAAEGWAQDADNTDRDDLFADCIADTRAVSAPCSDAEEGRLNAAQQTTLEDCTTAIEAAAVECAPMSGWESELAAAVPPAECDSQSNAEATFRTAQDAVAEPGSLLCARQVDALCAAAADCVEQTPGLDPDATGTPVAESCAAAFAPAVESCTSSGRLDHGLSLNAERDAAQQCAAALPSQSCETLLAAELSETCETGLGDGAAETLAAVLLPYTLGE